MCVCASMSPGMAVYRERSMISAPAGIVTSLPMARMRSLSTRMVALFRTLPEPSHTLPKRRAFTCAERLGMPARSMTRNRAVRIILLYTTQPCTILEIAVQMRRIAAIALGCTTLVCSLYALQRPFREYQGWEYSDFPLPPDWQVKGEWVFARLMYPTYRYPIDWQFRPSMDWTQGGTNWTIDYPRSDRHLAAAVRRLTRLDARSVEQPVNLDDGDDVYNWPW